MNIALDLSVIQTPHRMRGIGATAINFVNSMSDNTKKKHNFVLFLNAVDQESALSILDLRGINYEVRTLRSHKSIHLRLPGKLRIINSILNSLIKIYESRHGDSRLDSLSDIDYYLQFNQMQSLPKSNRHTLLGVVLYDLIPYIMEPDYLWSYRTARQKGCSRKSALRHSLLRKRYLGQLKTNGKRADRLFAISAHTKADFIKYTGTPERKVTVTHLGIDQTLPDKTPDDLTFNRYIRNSWGHFPEPIDLHEKPFLLFLGGADPRRKLIDLFAAYNNLKARGHDIRLVLAGDTLKGFDALPTAELQNYVAHESYVSDVAFLWFVDDSQREWLFDHALAMVYPSVYEGFGLPILEAMHYGTPVITYRNSSIEEIAGSAALYAHDYVTIFESARELLLNGDIRKHYEKVGKAQAAKFAWSRTVDSILSGFGV